MAEKESEVKRGEGAIRTTRKGEWPKRFWGKDTEERGLREKGGECHYLAGGKRGDKENASAFKRWCCLRKK